MNKDLCAGSQSLGFSLIEVVLALGIIAFAIVGIMGLFPAAMKSAQESQRETRATLIARQIFSDLVSMPATNTFIATNADLLNGRKSINLATDSTTVIKFNNEGVPVSSGATDAIFEATVAVKANSPSSGLSHIQASIRAINAASNSLSPYVFATLMDN